MKSHYSSSHFLLRLWKHWLAGALGLMGSVEAAIDIWIMWRLHWSLSVCRTAWILRYISSRDVIPRGVETVSEDFVLMATILILNAFKILWRLSVHIRQSENLTFWSLLDNFQTMPFLRCYTIAPSTLVLYHSLFSLPSLFHFSNVKLSLIFWWGMANISHTILLLFC